MNDVEKIFGTVKPPAPVAAIPGSTGAAQLGSFLTTTIQIIYIVAAIAFLFMVVLGAFQWIISGGDKEKVSSAQKRITHAIIGIILLALTFVFVRIIGQVTGFQFFVGQQP
jgi:hypothetical protein